MPNRVLIVDSNLASNVLLSKTLTKAGYETRTAFTADEAVTRVSQDKFDLIVADLGMPNGDSRNLLVKLNQSGASDTVPVLALADGLEDLLAKSALQLGASDILPKPVAAEALVNRVRRAIERGPRGQVSQRMKKGAVGRGPGETGGTPALGLATTPPGGINASASTPPGGINAGAGAMSPADFSGLDTAALEAIEAAARGGDVAPRAPQRDPFAGAGAAGASQTAASAASAPLQDRAPRDASSHAAHGQVHASHASHAQGSAHAAGAPPQGAPPAQGKRGPSNTPPPSQAPRAPASGKVAEVPSGATTEFGPGPARFDAPATAPVPSGKPSAGQGPHAASGPLAGSARTAAQTPGGPAGPAGDRAKTGVSTIQLDARNFVDKHAHDAEAKPPSASALSEGDELGLERRTYTVIRELAAGAMGGTYLVKRKGEKGSAYADELECVLKVSFGDPVADESLRVEQLVLGSIDHPNVVKLLDMGFLPGQDGARFVVLERLYPLPAAFYGKNDAPAHERATDPVTAMRVYLNLVGGLHAIHAKHRLILGDIKPDNVMLRMPRLDDKDAKADYTAKLARGDFEPVFIDFGSALSQEVLHTRKVETFTGSPAYMAPEVLTQGRHSARRDVFALSVTLYEMLTGDKPYGEVGGRPVPELVSAIKRGVPVVDLEKVKSIRFDEAFSEAAGPDGAAARTQFLRGVADMIARGADRDPAQRYSTYQLADECRIRFQVRPRHNPPPGARYETPIFEPLSPATIRYLQPPKPPPLEAFPEPTSEPPRHAKSGRMTKQGRSKATTGGIPGEDSVANAIGHSAAAYREGAGLLGPPPTATPTPAAAGTGAGSSNAAVRRLEIELAELRVQFLRMEERAQVAEESLTARELSLRKSEERAQKLEETARAADAKRAEASDKAKKALDRAQRAEEAVSGLEKRHAEERLSRAERKGAEAVMDLERRSADIEARAEKAEEAARLYRIAAEDAEARADRSEEDATIAAPHADKWREAADLLEQGAAAARLAADGARGVAEAARKAALSEVAGALVPLADFVEEASKDRPDDDPLRLDSPEARKLLDAVRALRGGRGHRPTS